MAGDSFVNNASIIGLWWSGYSKGWSMVGSRRWLERFICL